MMIPANPTEFATAGNHRDRERKKLGKNKKKQRTGTLV